MLQSALLVFLRANAADINYRYTPCTRANIDGNPFCTCGRGYYRSYEVVAQTKKSACVPCSPGTYQPHVNFTGGACFPCYGTTYAPGPAASECTFCPGRQWGHKNKCSDTKRRKKNFEPKTFYGQASRRRMSQACPRAPMSSNFDPFCYCGPGEYRKHILPGNFLQCVSCPKGKYQPHTGTINHCNNCTAGHQSNTASTNCIACNPGLYANAPGSDCKSCPAGYTEHVPGSFACTRCSPGMASDIVESTSEYCMQCEPGKFSDEPALSYCKLCPAGYTEHVFASLECTPCAFGRYSNMLGDSRDHCTACDPGFYAAEKAQIICTFCQPGKYQDREASTGCSLAHAGYVPTEMRDALVKCEPGSFTDLPGLPKCKECRPGQTQHLYGAHGCTPCAKGHATALIGNSNHHCDPCSRGRFSDTMGLSDCKSCAKGTFQELQGSHNCSLAHAGYYPSSNREFQLPCKRGTYSDVRGLDSCKLCDAGMFADTIGRIKCTPCSGGHAAPNRGAHQCDSCLPGRWSNSTGSNECSLCQPGKTTDHYHAYKCDLCAPGHAQPNQGGDTEHCPACKTGFFAKNYGEKTCSSCGIWGYNTESGSMKCYECLTQEAMFGFSHIQQCTITWLLLLTVVGSVVLCCGCICWCKEGCPLKFCCRPRKRQEKIAFEVNRHLERALQSQHYMPPYSVGSRSAPSILGGDKRKNRKSKHNDDGNVSFSQKMSVFEVETSKHVENPIHDTLAEDMELVGA